MTRAIGLVGWIAFGVLLAGCPGGAPAGDAGNVGDGGNDVANDAAGDAMSDAAGDTMDDVAGDAGAYVPDPTCPERGVCFDLPAPTGWNLYGLAVASSTEVWIAGEHGTVLLYDGAEFLGARRSQWADVDLLEVALSPSYVWIAGREGTLLRGRRDARPPAFEPLPTGVTGEAINSVWAADDTHVWLGTENGTVLFYNGTQFDAQLTDAGGFVALSGLDATHVWAAAVRSPEVMTYAWDGTSWSPIGTLAGGAGGPYVKIHAFAPDDVWSNAFTGSLFHYDGATWSDSGQTVYPITGMAGAARTLFVSGGQALQRLSNGTLEALTIPWPRALDWEDISATDSGEVWAAGRGGLMVHGTSAALQFAGTWQDTAGVTTLSVADGTVLASGARTLVRDPQGWNLVASTARAPTDVLVFSASDAWAATPQGLQRFDGTTWTTVTTPTGFVPVALRGFAPGDVYVGGGISRDSFAMLHWDGTTLQAETSDVALVGTVVDVEGPADNLWAATDTRAVLHRENGTWVVERPAGGSGSASYVHLAVLGPQDVMAFFALATEHERWNGTTWSVMPRTPFGGPKSTYTSPEGVPFVAGVDGLFVLRDGNWLGARGIGMVAVAGGPGGMFALDDAGRVYRVDPELLGR